MTSGIVFSDLDGTLLDSTTYAFDPARPALAALRSRGIPLVPVTTKTAAETLRVQERLGVRGPFVAEDGAAVGWPRGSFPDAPGGLVRFGDVDILPLALARENFRDVVEAFRRLVPGRLTVLSELDPAAAARETGLSLADAAAACRRHFDEAFRVDGEFPLESFERLAQARGLRLTRGGRWLHLHGETDKGDAVRLLRGLMGPARAVGVGDSALDLPLLAAVDVAVAVPKADGAVDPLLAAHPGVIVAPKPGPEGWNAAVLGLL